MTSIARVYVNQIEVGALPSAQYRAVVEQTRHDWRLYVQQVFNVAFACLWFLIASFRLVPTLLFIAGAAAAIWVPEEITASVIQLATITPEQLSQGIQRLLLWCTVFAVILHCSVFMMFFSGFHKFGYINVFDRAVNKQIRRVLEVPAEGDMFVHIVDEAGDDENDQ